MKLEKDIDEWTQKQLSEHCGKSRWGNCCNGRRFLIGICNDEKEALELFSELKVPIYTIRELNKGSVAAWLTSDYFVGDIKTKNEKLIPKPSIIEHPYCEYLNGKNTKWQKGTEFALYLDKYCPAYDKEKGCIVHDDPRRPRGCRQYPIIHGRENGVIKAQIKKSCPGIRLIKGIEDKFKKAFPNVLLDNFLEERK